VTAIFISDVHIKDSGSIKTQLVIRFLQEVASQFDQIYILGDLFDIWPGTSGYFVGLFKPVLDVLKRLVDEGHEVYYVEGNHDFLLGDYFSTELGIHVAPNELVKEINGRKVFMTHGDLGNPNEFGYRVLRYALRHPATQSLVRALPQHWVYESGLRGAHLSRTYQKKSEVVESTIRQIYRKTAESIFRQGYDVVLMGHTHLPDDVSTIVNGRSCRYINTGDWIRHFTYLEFRDGDFYTKTHPVKDL